MREFLSGEENRFSSQLKLNRSEVPALDKGKELVGVKSIGLNYSDIFAFMGLYGATPKADYRAFTVKYIQTFRLGRNWCNPFRNSTFENRRSTL